MFLKPVATKQTNSPMAKNVSLSIVAASLQVKSSDATSLRSRRLGSFWGSASRFSCSARDVMAPRFGDRSLRRKLREENHSRPADEAAARTQPPLPAPLWPGRPSRRGKDTEPGGDACPCPCPDPLSRSRSPPPTWPLPAGPHVGCARRSPGSGCSRASGSSRPGGDRRARPSPGSSSGSGRRDRAAEREPAACAGSHGTLACVRNSVARRSRERIVRSCVQFCALH